MFGFLKDKLKKIASVFTKATTEEVRDEEAEKPKERLPPKKEQPKPTQKTAPAKKEPKKQLEKRPAVEKQIKKKDSIALPVHERTEAENNELIEEISEVAPLRDEDVSVVAAEEIAEEKREEQLKQGEPEKRSFLDKLLGRKKETVAEEKHVEKKHGKTSHEKQHAHKQETVTVHEERKPVAHVEAQEEPSGFFGKLKAAIITKKLSREDYDKIFDEIEVELLENNVALEVVDKLKDDLWQGISTERFNRFSPEKRVQAALTQSISELFLEPFDILKAAREKVIYVICAIGINGSGKTTTLAKLAQYFKDNKLEPVLAAGDTFRAAAIQQLEEHANKIGVKLIKQQYGADAAAVAFDAIQYAKANKCRVVLIDTAGRLHSNTNLMEEMKKIIRVARPDCTIFIGEATTGNDCVEQAVQFQQAVPIDGIVLSKVDVDERGGAALSISYVTRKPILFFGTGQTYKDLEPFNREKIVEQLTAE